MSLVRQIQQLAERDLVERGRCGWMVCLGRCVGQYALGVSEREREREGGEIEKEMLRINTQRGPYL